MFSSYNPNIACGVRRVTMCHISQIFGTSVGIVSGLSVCIFSDYLLYVYRDCIDFCAFFSYSATFRIGWFMRQPEAFSGRHLPEDFVEDPCTRERVGLSHWLPKASPQ